MSCSAFSRRSELPAPKRMETDVACEAAPPSGAASGWAVEDLIWEELFLSAKWFPFRRARELCDGA